MSEIEPEFHPGYVAAREAFLKEGSLEERGTAIMRCLPTEHVLIAMVGVWSLVALFVAFVVIIVNPTYPLLPEFMGFWAALLLPGGKAALRIGLAILGVRFPPADRLAAWEKREESRHRTYVKGILVGLAIPAVLLIIIAPGFSAFLLLTAAFFFQEYVQYVPDIPPLVSQALWPFGIGALLYYGFREDGTPSLAERIRRRKKRRNPEGQ